MKYLLSTAPRNGCKIIIETQDFSFEGRYRTDPEKNTDGYWIALEGGLETLRDEDIQDARWMPLPAMAQNIRNNFCIERLETSGQSAYEILNKWGKTIGQMRQNDHCFLTRAIYPDGATDIVLLNDRVQPAETTAEEQCGNVMSGLVSLWQGYIEAGWQGHLGDDRKKSST